MSTTLRYQIRPLYFFYVTDLKLWSVLNKQIWLGCKTSISSLCNWSWNCFAVKFHSETGMATQGHIRVVFGLLLLCRWAGQEVTQAFVHDWVLLNRPPFYKQSSLGVYGESLLAALWNSLETLDLFCSLRASVSLRMKFPRKANNLGNLWIDKSEGKLIFSKRNGDIVWHPVLLIKNK